MPWSFVGNGDGGFKARITYAAGVNPCSVTLGDLTGDSVLDMAIANYNADKAEVSLANTTQATTTPYLNINTREGALAAMDTLDSTLQRISRELGAIGSTQSRFQVTLNTLAVSRENFAAAGGRIMDADVAEESSVLVRTQILQQAGAAVLGQANQQPALALQLLRT